MKILYYTILEYIYLSLSKITPQSLCDKWLTIPQTEKVTTLNILKFNIADYK